MANFAPQREKNIVSGGALEPPRVQPCPLNLPPFCTPGITPDRQRTYNNEGGRTRTEGVKASGRDHPPGCLRAPPETIFFFSLWGKIRHAQILSSELIINF